jgi:adenylyltransferase/sulfurtransferase
MIQNLTPIELREWISEGKDFSLVDVRESYEHEAFNIGGKLIPLGDLINAQDEIDRDKPVVLYCEKGIRSQIAIQRLEALGYRNLYNLVGGMAGWRVV